MSGLSGSEAARRAARIRLLLALLLTGLVVIAWHLGYLQLLHAQDYLALGRANAVQTEHLSPLRGRILARDGTVLAGNRVAVDRLYRGAAPCAGRGCATCWGSPARRATPTPRTPRRRGAGLEHPRRDGPGGRGADRGAAGALPEKTARAHLPDRPGGARRRYHHGGRPDAVCRL